MFSDQERNEWSFEGEQKLEAIKIQRKRMEHLKNIIQKYSRTIDILTKKIEWLQSELSEERQLRLNYKQMDKSRSQQCFLIELEKKQNVIIEQQYIIQNLKLQLETNKPLKNVDLLSRYSNLIENYKKCRKQLESKEKENQKILQILNEVNNKYLNKSFRSQNKHSTNPNMKNTLNQQQLNDQTNLIKKYKSNQQNYERTIEQLKNQKQKICACHYKGKKRSQKLLTNHLIIDK